MGSYVTVEVLNPRAEATAPPTASSAARLASLAGKKIGILDNGKPAGRGMLLPYMLEALKRRIPDVEIRTWAIPFAQPEVVKDPKIRELAEYADGVIALLGD